MAANKRYVANNRPNLLLIINLPEQKGQVTIGFQTGYGLLSEGYYLTDDEELQKAMETDHRYGKSFRLAEIDGMPIAEYEVRNLVAKTMEPLPEEAPEPKEPEYIEKVFTNLDTARQWLNTKHGVPMSKMSTKKAATDCYKDLGYQLEFEKN